MTPTRSTMASQPPHEPENLVQLLTKAATLSSPQVPSIATSEETHVNRILFINEYSRLSNSITYCQLWETAKANSVNLRPIIHQSSVKKDSIIILYLEDHYENIIWYWSILLAGGVPCLLPTLPQDEKSREKVIRHLQKLLENPSILTSKKSTQEFKAIEGLNIETIEALDSIPPNPSKAVSEESESFSKVIQTPSSNLATLCLTSGSTSLPKAVCLTHRQILASIRGKSQLQSTTRFTKFLNWTSFTHVACLLEIHLQALLLSAAQFHVPGSYLLASPTSFLDHISKYRISYTFAPNFFLGMVAEEVESGRVFEIHEEGGYYENKNEKLDLSCLEALITGGEANPIATLTKVVELLEYYNVPKHFLRPGFGMTETCAGSIYNVLDCPSYDVAQGLSFACLGKGIYGIQMRISRLDDTECERNEVGELQVEGDVIFEGYYGDMRSSFEARNREGWLKTGDRGWIDKEGRLNLCGREKDLLVINGLNHHPQSIENAIEAAKIPGVLPSWIAAFGHRIEGSDTESLVVVYREVEPKDNFPRTLEIAKHMTKAIIKQCGARPYKIIPLTKAQLPKSTLGKLSRSGLKKAFEAGNFDDQIRHGQELIRKHKEETSDAVLTPNTETQKLIFDVSAELFGFKDIKTDDDIFELGLSSIELLKFRLALQKKLQLRDITITTFFYNPIIKDLGHALDRLKSADIVAIYNPIVTLQPHGTKNPIFFIHPGVGEVLIFLNISRYFTNRPVHAIRARGFDDEPLFTSMSEMISTYYASIKRTQPTGPYAICGYSFGAILAFEIAKLMEKNGDELQFLGTIDQAPHFKERARGYDWCEVAITLAFFLDFIKEKYAYDSLPEMRAFSKDEVLDHIFYLAPSSRVKELDMNRVKFEKWVDLAFGLKVLSRDYDPEGIVKKMDVFYAGPLVGLVKAKTREEWLRDFIGKWEDLVEEGECKFHFVGGTHRTLISPPFLDGFWKSFEEAMKQRGM